MNISKALEIVLELASQNIIDDPEMEEESARQNEAIKKIISVLAFLKGDCPQNLKAVKSAKEKLA